MVQGKAHVLLRWGNWRHSQEMQPKLPDTIIWLPQKITINYAIIPAQVKPRPHERGTDSELCVSSPRFTRHRHKFVQTFNFVQISWHCLHNIAGAVSDHSSHRERGCTGVVSVRWMSQHYTKIIKLKYCEKKNNNCSLFQSSKLRKKIYFTVV